MATTCAKHVIHTVGPVYRDGQRGEPGLLRSCYEESLRLAHSKAAATIAFPCISTGVYGYPKADACRIAVDAVVAWLEQNESPREVIFCCFGSDDGELYRSYLAERVGEP